MERPHFQKIKTAKEFRRWYWLKEELIDICKRSNIPYSGGKFELQDRIAYALENGGQILKRTTIKKSSKFNCHGDFMDWVKENFGKTLQDAINQLQLLEDRKKDPNFKREIAAHNMYAQYTRDFLKDNPGMTIKDAKEYWLLKRQLPTETGFVKYLKSDLKLT